MIGLSGDDDQFGDGKGNDSGEQRNAQLDQHPFYTQKARFDQEAAGCHSH